ncbi:MAG: acyltransferase [Acetobacter aceti]|nr:acyltransferase [Acetobacter aceti]
MAEMILERKNVPSVQKTDVELKKQASGHFLPRIIPALTGIRGAAALGIAVHHMLPPMLKSLNIHSLDHSVIVENGFRSVDLFFILSGFILMLTHGDEFRTGNLLTLKRFFILRFVRVYPLHIVIMFLIVPIVLLFPDFVHWSRTYSSPEFAYKVHNFSWPGFVQSLLLVQTWTVVKLGEWNGPSWSLSAEVLGYLLFPCLAWGLLYLKKPAVLHGLAGCILAGECVLLAVTHHAYNNPSGTMGAVRMLGGFGAGMALGRAVLAAGPLVGRRASLVTWGSLGFVVCTLAFPELSPVMVFGFAWLLFGLAYQQDAVGRLLGSRIFLWLGILSFPFYMVHFILFKVFMWGIEPEILHSGTAEILLAWGCLFLIMIFCTVLLHKGVERPSHRLARRLAGPRISS